MTALRLGNDKKTFVEGMRLLSGLLEVLSNKDAGKILKEAISMSEDEIQASQEAKAYVESGNRVRAVIAAERAEADQQIEQAKAAIVDAKGAIATSKQTLNENEGRLKLLTDQLDKKTAAQIEKDVFLKSEELRLNKLSAYLSEQAVQQDKKQSQLTDLEQKLRGKAAAAADLMKGV